jgi:hypothetical protein
MRQRSAKMWSPENLIFRYTRAQAIADGVLVDITAIAREAGIRFPVALTSSLYHEYLVPHGDASTSGQSTEGRLWDLLQVFRTIARVSDESELRFSVLFTDSSSKRLEPVEVKALCHPGDEYEPVITIMLPMED